MIDITVPLFKGIEPFEGDPLYEQSFVMNVASGDMATVSKLALCSHTGTHIDSPFHYFESGKSIDQIDVSKFIGPCQVIEIQDSELIDNLIPLKSIQNKIHSPRVLLKTKNSKTPGKFDKDFVGIDLEAAKYIVQQGVILIGIDGYSIEAFTGDGSVHKELLSHEIPILEIINLTNVEPGDYNLTCLPLKITGCDAAPARAILQKI